MQSLAQNVKQLIMLRMALAKNVVKIVCNALISLLAKLAGLDISLIPHQLVFLLNP
jgi:hypothetical protein